MRLNPAIRPSTYSIWVGHTTRLGGMPRRSPTLQELLSRSPNFPYAHFLLAASYMFQWYSQRIRMPRRWHQAMEATQRTWPSITLPPGSRVLGRGISMAKAV